MNISREEKKAEAIRRMKKIGLFEQTIKQFEKDDLVSISEPPLGFFFWVEGVELAEMKEFERKYNALVYCIVRSYTEFGVLDSYMYVSDFKDEWEIDNDMLKDNEALVYVVNRNAPVCSEFGSIGFERTVAAGLLRVW